MRRRHQAHFPAVFELFWIMGIARSIGVLRMTVDTADTRPRLGLELNQLVEKM